MDQSITVEFHVKCFCGLMIAVGHADGKPMLLHPEPACERFMSDEPADKFLRALRCLHTGSN